VLGRFPIHFNQNGPSYKSYVRNNAIHHSYSRCISLIGTSFLEISTNVGYRTHGHMVHLADSTAHHNIIMGNLMVQSFSSWLMLSDDNTPANFYVSSPDNFLLNNRAGGAQWYGFWYALKANCGSKCPQGT
jgi:cell migration-inducing and hyaluronan-binding protein